MDMAVRRGRRATDKAFSGPLYSRIRHARKVARLSQAQLAKLLGVGGSAVAQWEIPKGTAPTVTHLIDVAKTCGVSFEWLATGRGPVAIDGAEMPAVDAFSMAADAVEDRLLAAFRRVPERKREAVVCWIEEFFG